MTTVEEYVFIPTRNSQLEEANNLPMACSGLTYRWPVVDYVE